MAGYEQKVQESSSCSIHKAGCFSWSSVYTGILEDIGSNASKGMDLGARHAGVVHIVYHSNKNIKTPYWVCSVFPGTPMLSFGIITKVCEELCWDFDVDCIEYVDFFCFLADKILTVKWIQVVICEESKNELT
ncbi:hypothetical protein STEG23_019450 [Scotinomys teguina]